LPCMGIGRGVIGVRAKDVKDAAADAADSEPIGWAARAGLTARGVVWIVIGILGVLLAQGAQTQHADQKGAVQELLSKPFGDVLVILMALGFVGYALWRLSEAAFGVTGSGMKVGPRLQSLARGVVYLVLAGTAVSVLLGSSTSQSSQQETVTAQVMSHPGGRIPRRGGAGDHRRRRRARGRRVAGEVHAVLPRGCPPGFADSWSVSAGSERSLGVGCSC
jgi:hypothetical protein